MKALAFKSKDAALTDPARESRWPLIAVLASVLLTIAIPTTLLWPAAKPALATGNIGPWKADFNNADVNFVVSTTPDVSIPTTQILLYFSSPVATTVTISSAGLADTGSDTDIYSGGVIAQATSYNLYTGIGFGTLLPGGVWASNSTGALAISIAANALTFDPNTNKYIAMLRVSLNVGSSQNGFKVSLPAVVGNYVGYDSSLPATNFGLDEASTPTGKHYTPYDIQFGPRCGVPAVVGDPKAKLTWFDADNGTSGIQTSPVSFKLQQTNRVTNVKSFVKFTSIAGSTDGTTWNGTDTVTPGSISNEGGVATFTALPNMKYDWLWSYGSGGIFDNNTIQLGIPYDSIYYITGCALKPYVLGVNVTNSAPYLEPGKTYPDLINPGFFTAITNPNPFSADPYTITMSTVGTTAPLVGYSFPSQSEPYLGPSSNASWAFPVAIQVAATAKEGDQVCFTPTINPGSYSAAGVFGSVTGFQRCWAVHVELFPTLVGMASDIHAGGGTCGGAIPPLPVNNIIGNSKANSLGQYVVSASGAVNNNFGSNNGPLSNSASIGTYTKVCRPDLGAAWTEFSSAVPTGYTAKQLGPVKIDLSTLNAQKTVYYRLSSSELIGGPVRAGANLPGATGENRLTIVIEGDLTISGDIKLNGGKFAADAQPSLGIIVTGNIYIKGNVTRVDAFLFAGGEIDTCSDLVYSSGSPIYTPACANELKVNGFLMANTLGFHRLGDRTGRQSGPVPAETITMIPQLYLNPPILFGNLATTNLTQDQGELPPVQ